MHRAALLFPFLLCGGATLAGAQDAGNTPPVHSPMRVEIVSQELADLGRTGKNPLQLIVAAGMRQRLGVKAMGRMPEGGGPGEADPYAVDALLKDARAIAGADGALITALSEDVRASATKGRTGIKGYSVATLKGAGTDWYRNQKFDAGKYAEVSVRIISGGSFDLFLYDAKGNLVCRDVRQNSSGYCGWTPGAEGTFDIKIENRTGQPIKYSMSTN